MLKRSRSDIYNQNWTIFWLHGNFWWGKFLIGWWKLNEEWFWSFKLFSELKATFCKYWILINTKISMTCVYKDYKVNISMSTAKNKMFENSCLFEEENKKLIGKFTGGNCSMWGEGLLVHPEWLPNLPSRESPVCNTLL